MFYDCLVCLGDPCSEVHGMLLVIDTNRRGGRCLFVYLCIYLFVTFNGQCARIAIWGCMLC